MFWQSGNKSKDTDLENILTTPAMIPVFLSGFNVNSTNIFLVAVEAPLKNRARIFN